MEAYVYGGHRLYVHLSVLFNLFLIYGYVPNTSHSSTIIPLVKNKSGELSDDNNYRAIALSNSITEILESLYCFVLLIHVIQLLIIGSVSKRFTPHHCALMFLKRLNHYRQNGSHVLACFIDFNKAFDNVDYWLLFSKLIDNTITQVCYALLLCAYLPSGTIIKKCLFVGRTYRHSLSILRMVYAKVAFFRHSCFAAVFVI